MAPHIMNSNLHAVVDMGSNGIRFSITDLTPPTARILPTIFQDRAAISLYDAQYSSENNTTTGTNNKVPIPAEVINAVISRLRQFKRTCQDFRVPDTNIRVVATEATREAVNSDAFRAEIFKATGWQVDMLSKEDEGRIGALGVASSFDGVQGLVMDLGGGSTQMTWMDTYQDDGSIPMQSVSLPYGAAALSRRLHDAAQQGGQAQEQLAEEVRTRLAEGFRSLSTPAHLRQHQGNDHALDLFLSGGGFRGWGYVLMSEHAVQPYPISTINGFAVDAAAFMDTDALQQTVARKYTSNTIGSEANHDEDDEISNDEVGESGKDSDQGQGIFRVSERRADQFPAVSFLVRNLVKVLPNIRQVHFCQGGVREGILFGSLPTETKRRHPLEVATEPFATYTSSADGIFGLLRSAIPDSVAADAHGGPLVLPDYLRLSLKQAMYMHGRLPKETRAAAALRSTTTGVLAQAHGISHRDRAALALLLCERWGGAAALSPVDVPFLTLLRHLVGPCIAWWCQYMGRVAALAGEVWPAGVWDDDAPARLKVITAYKTSNKHLLVTLRFDGSIDAQAYSKAIAAIKKAGKKKNWVRDGSEVFGLKIDVVIQPP